MDVFWDVTPCNFVVLDIHAVSTSETSVSYHNTTRRHNPEDLDLNLHHRKSLKSWSITYF